MTDLPESVFPAAPPWEATVALDADSDVPERWLALGAQGVYNVNAVEGMSEIRSRLNARAALTPVLYDLQRQIRELQADAYVSWRTALPGDTRAVAIAAAVHGTLAAVLDMIQNGGSDD